MTLTSTLESLSEVSGQILQAFPDSRVFALYGRMGAGKTTLIKELCHKLDVVDEVQSPTFSIINEYKTTRNESVFHFDFYRMKSVRELDEFGFDEYIDGDGVCLLEWADMIEERLPARRFEVRCALGETETQRTITIVTPPERT